MNITCDCGYSQNLINAVAADFDDLLVFSLSPP